MKRLLIWLMIPALLMTGLSGFMSCGGDDESEAPISTPVTTPETDEYGLDITGADWSNMTLAEKQDWVNGSLDSMIAEGQLTEKDRPETKSCIQRLDAIFYDGGSQEGLVAAQLATVIVAVQTPVSSPSPMPSPSPTQASTPPAPTKTVHVTSAPTPTPTAKPSVAPTSPSPTAEAEVGTTVSGVLTSDSTWTEADSPYIVAGSIAVASGATLRIEPGVRIAFEESPTGSAYYLQVDGTLIASGTDDKKITFTSNGSHYWNGLKMSGKGTLLEHCIIEYAGASGAAGAVINITPSSESTTMEACIVRNIRNPGRGVAYTVLSVEGDARIVGNEIEGQWVVLRDALTHFSGNRVAVQEFIVSGGTPTIVNNDITTNTWPDSVVGISLADGCAATISHNSIVNHSTNGRCVIFLSNFEVDDPRPTVQYNNINANGVLAVQLNDPYDIGTLDFSHNWWGTTDTAEIDLLIYDSHDDFNVQGQVDYQPIESSEIMAAGVQ